MKKRLIAFAVSLILAFSCLPQFTLPASAAETSGTCGRSATWSFNSATGTLTISGTGAVKTEDLMAEKQWYPFLDQIKSVVVEPGILELESYAFAYCKNLQRVSLPKTLVSMIDMVFYKCTSLKSIDLPDSIVNLGGGVFMNCTALTSIRFPSKLETIWSQMLMGCTSLTSVTLPPNVKTIMSSAFQDCTKLTSIQIPSGVKEIGFNAFLNTGIYNQESNWVGNVLHIGPWAIAGKADATEIIIKDGTKYIADSAFSGMKSLVKVEFPETLTAIGRSAFSGDQSLVTLDFPNSLTTIGSYAFAECTALEEITIPASVTLIEKCVFNNCGNLDVTILNPTCRIIGAEDHLPMTLGVHEKAVIRGYDGSTAQEYAEHFHQSFVSLGQAPFTDVPTGTYYEEAVSWAVENEITNGTAPGRFSPNKGCTRSQVVTFLWRAAGCPEPEKTDTSFTDVMYGAYYKNAVAWAVENGITNGLTETTFGPDATCTRGQIVTFLWRFKESPVSENAQSAFTDLKPNAFYLDAVAWAVENRVTNGMTDTTFCPDLTCTRAQVVTFLFRAMSITASDPENPDPADPEHPIPTPTDPDMPIPENPTPGQQEDNA